LRALADETTLASEAQGRRKNGLATENGSLIQRNIGNVGEGDSCSQKVQVSSVSGFNSGHSSGQGDKIRLSERCNGSVIS